jgi:hypothetical protein
MTLDAEEVYRSLGQADTNLEQVLDSLSDGRKALGGRLAAYVDPATGDTALHALAQRKEAHSLKLCQLLCRRGASVWAQNNAGDTPLQVAHAHGHQQLAQHLAAQQAEEAVSRRAQHLYFLLTQGDCSSVLEQLAANPAVGQCLARYVDPHTGWTALHQAAYHNHQGLAARLIELGADLQAATKGGATAADVAQHLLSGHAAMVGLLEEAGLGHPAPLAPPAGAMHLLPSSSEWSPSHKRTASSTLHVSYAGGVVTIPAGSHYWTDAAGAVLVGWHGSYDPPCGMDGESMVP